MTILDNLFSDIDEYLLSKEGVFVESTLREHRSKLIRFSKIFMEMRANGKITANVPAEIKERDIRLFVQWLRLHDIDPVTQKKYLQILNGYLLFNGNNSVSLFRSQTKWNSPNKPIKVLSVEEIGKIFDTIDKMEGWRGSVARGMIYLAFETLARPTEIRTAFLCDLDMITHTFYVRNPKGKGSFASAQTLEMINPDYLPQLDRYLSERAAYLMKKGMDSNYLFPNLYYGSGGLYSANAQRELIREISHRSGVDFSLKVFRSTGADLFVSLDYNNLTAISAQLRHENLATTQRYYANIQKGKVNEQLRDAYKKIHIPRSEN